VIHPEESTETERGAFVDIAVPPAEKDRIDHLLDRYDVLLAQAEDLSLQIEELLQEWNPVAPPTVGPVSNPLPRDGSQK
jgi:hypothetical protein